VAGDIFPSWKAVVVKEAGKSAGVQINVEAKICIGCNAVMVDARHLSQHSRKRLAQGQAGPPYFDEVLPQLERGEIKIISELEDDNGWYCRDCAAKNLAKFVCAMCDQERPSSEVKKSFGFGLQADYLCKDCYATQPARAWDAKVDELYASHPTTISNMVTRVPGQPTGNGCAGWFDPQSVHHICDQPYAPLMAGRDRCSQCHSRERRFNGVVRSVIVQEVIDEETTDEGGETTRQKKVTTLRFAPELLTKIDAAAKRRGVSRTAWIMMAASRAVDEGL